MTSESERWILDFVEMSLLALKKPFDDWAFQFGVGYPADSKHILVAHDDFDPSNLSGSTHDFFVEINGRSYEFSLSKRERDLYRKASLNDIEDKIRFLVKLRKILVERNFEVENKNVLLDLIDSKILVYTPTLEFKIDKQIELLRSEIKHVGIHFENAKIPERFQDLEETKIRIVPARNREDRNKDKPVLLEATKRNSPSKMIRALSTVIQKYCSCKPDEHVGRINLWINYLFLDVEGFSLDHIQRAKQGHWQKGKAFQ